MGWESLPILHLHFIIHIYIYFLTLTFTFHFFTFTGFSLLSKLLSQHPWMGRPSETDCFSKRSYTLQWWVASVVWPKLGRGISFSKLCFGKDIAKHSVWSHDWNDEKFLLLCTSGWHSSKTLVPMRGLLPTHNPHLPLGCEVKRFLAVSHWSHVIT